MCDIRLSSMSTPNVDWPSVSPRPVSRRARRVSFSAESWRDETSDRAAERRRPARRATAERPPKRASARSVPRVCRAALRQPPGRNGDAEFPTCQPRERQVPRLPGGHARRSLAASRQLHGPKTRCSGRTAGQKRQPAAGGAADRPNPATPPNFRGQIPRSLRFRAAVVCRYGQLFATPKLRAV